MEGIIYQYDNIKTINLNEYDLIVKSINSDYDSFANLMKLHKRHLYQMAYIHTRDKDMALDIIQETTIVAFKNIKSTAKIKVPSKKLRTYKNLLKGKGQGRKVKITK